MVYSAKVTLPLIPPLKRFIGKKIKNSYPARKLTGALFD
jgi:hypothetical protein